VVPIAAVVVVKFNFQDLGVPQLVEEELFDDVR
jgi:hypothetical protein